MVGRDGQGVSEEGLRAHLATRLPEYMLPSRIVTLEAMPLTPNGKIDRARLPDAEPKPAGKVGGEPPRTPTEVRLASIWQDILGLEHISRDDDFFRLGGHSLTAISMLARVAEIARVEISFADLLQHPVLRELAVFVENLRGSHMEDDSPEVGTASSKRRACGRSSASDPGGLQSTSRFARPRPPAVSRA